VESLVNAFFQYSEIVLDIKLTEHARNIIRQEIMNAWATNNINFVQNINYSVNVILPQLVNANPTALNYWRSINQPQIIAALQNSYDTGSKVLLDLYNQKFTQPYLQQSSSSDQSNITSTAYSNQNPANNPKNDEMIVQEIVDEMIKSPGTFDKNKLGRLTETQADKVIKKLTELGAGQGHKTLDIASYYREGTEKYKLQWQSKWNNMGFDHLDRKTQFFVLFSEWSERELDGMQILDSGKLDEAMKVFEECLARAEQLNVGDLKAKSYEDMMRIAKIKGDRQAELKWLNKAAQARS
jgi:hypothetical protein